MGVCYRLRGLVICAHLQNDYTTAAVAHLKTALEILDERIKDREARGVLQTYQK